MTIPSPKQVVAYLVVLWALACASFVIEVVEPTFKWACNVLDIPPVE